MVVAVAVEVKKTRRDGRECTIEMDDGVSPPWQKPESSERVSPSSMNAITSCSCRITDEL